MKYQVVVGNLGTVYDGDDSTKAVAIFNEYCEQSRGGYGRVSEELVSLLKGGEIDQQNTEFNDAEHYPDEMELSLVDDHFNNR